MGRTVTYRESAKSKFQFNPVLISGEGEERGDGFKINRAIQVRAARDEGNFHLRVTVTETVLTMHDAGRICALSYTGVIYFRRFTILRFRLFYYRIAI